MSTITSENLVEVTGAVAGQRAILKNGKAILVGMGGMTTDVGGTDVSMTTATEADVLNTVQFYKADGTFVSGSIETVVPTLNENVFTVGKGYISEKTELTIPEATIIETEDKVTVGIGYNSSQKEYNISSGGSSTKFYKCASVDMENKTWTGYLYDTETKTFADTLIEGLSYTFAVVPTIGKVYTADGSIECDVESQITGLLLYAKLNESSTIVDTGQYIGEGGYYETTTYSTVKGVSCAYFNRFNYLFIPNIKIEGEWTLSIMANTNQSSLTGSTNYCALSCGANSDNSGFRFHTYKAANLGVKFYCDNINNPEIGAYADYTSDEWYHYTMQYKNGSLIMFRNGVQQEATSDLVCLFYDKLYIGTRFGGTDSYSGYLAELKIWRRALSPEEIKAEADRCLAMVESEEDSGSSDSGSSGELPEGYKLQLSGVKEPNDSCNGIYTMESATATGTDRIWVNDNGSGYKIVYNTNFGGWMLYDGSAVIPPQFNADNPWETTGVNDLDGNPVTLTIYVE